MCLGLPWCAQTVTVYMTQDVTNSTQTERFTLKPTETVRWFEAVIWSVVDTSSVQAELETLATGKTQDIYIGLSNILHNAAALRWPANIPFENDDYTNWAVSPSLLQQSQVRGSEIHTELEVGGCYGLRVPGPIVLLWGPGCIRTGTGRG